MNSYKLSNITLPIFREFLVDMKCSYAGVRGGHEKWRKAGCGRPVIFQTHFKTIPELVLKNNLKVLGLSRDDFIQWLKER